MGRQLNDSGSGCDDEPITVVGNGPNKGCAAAGQKPKPKAPVLDRYPNEMILGQYSYPDVVRKIIIVQRFVRRRLASREIRQERMSTKILDELIETEEIYVKSLQLCLDHFHAPLLNISKSRGGFISADEVKHIFSDLVVIQLYNQNFLADLYQRKVVQEGVVWKDRKYGDILDSITKFLRTYTAYYNNYNNALVTLSKCSEKPKFLEWLEKQELAIHETLPSLLIRPIQRVPKYVLLLRDLLRNTPATHPDYKNLKDAGENMEEIARGLNERMKDAEVFMEVIRINSQVSPKCDNLVEPHRRFIREGAVM